MSWTLVRAEFNELPPDLSPFVEIFRCHGVENTLEDDSGLQGCVVEVEGSRNIVQDLKLDLLRGGVSDVKVEPYVEQDWEIAWRQFFKPRRIGNKIVVAPTWEAAETRPGDILLVLDPGQAFGTGDHPTTRLCLELLDGMNLNEKEVADVGCGSGILAIAACKLGAEVVAIDIDPVAIEVAKENASRNGVSLRTFCGDGLARTPRDPSTEELKLVPQDELPLGSGESPAVESGDAEAHFDVVVSNIISATLIRLSDRLTSAVKPGGSWIVSGIIEDNWSEVRKTAENLGLILARDLHEDGWVAAEFLKR